MSKENNSQHKNQNIKTMVLYYICVIIAIGVSSVIKRFLLSQYDVLLSFWAGIVLWLVLSVIFFRVLRRLFMRKS